MLSAWTPVVVIAADHPRTTQAGTVRVNPEVKTAEGEVVVQFDVDNAQEAVSEKALQALR